MRRQREHIRTAGPRGNRESSRSLRQLLGVLSVLGITIFGSTLMRPRPTELVIQPRLLTRLQTLAEGLHREIVLCLQGSVHGGVATADDFTMPTPRVSTPTRSTFDRCPGGTLASWHNHPLTPSGRIPASYSSVVGAPESRRLCVLSETDIGTAEKLRHPFVVVAVDAATWCWWSLDEVDHFAARRIAPAPPAPERMAWGGPTSAWALPSSVGRGSE